MSDKDIVVKPELVMPSTDKRMKKPTIQAVRSFYVGGALIVTRGERLTESAMAKRFVKAMHDQKVIK